MFAQEEEEEEAIMCVKSHTHVSKQWGLSLRPSPRPERPIKIWALLLRINVTLADSTSENVASLHSLRRDLKTSEKLNPVTTSVQNILGMLAVWTHILSYESLCNLPLSVYYCPARRWEGDVQTDVSVIEAWSSWAFPCIATLVNTFPLKSIFF